LLTGAILGQRLKLQHRTQSYSWLVHVILASILWHGKGNNDINVLNCSSVVNDMLKGEHHDMSFEVNGHVYPHYYLLTDGIYL
jgi:hypothetical protein